MIAVRDRRDGWVGLSFLTLTIRSEPRLESAKPSTRAKWRSSTSAYGSVLKIVLDTADIVRDGDISPMKMTWHSSLLTVTTKCVLERVSKTCANLQANTSRGR